MARFKTVWIVDRDDLAEEVTDLEWLFLCGIYTAIKAKKPVMTARTVKDAIGATYTTQKVINDINNVIVTLDYKRLLTKDIRAYEFDRIDVDVRGVRSTLKTQLIIFEILQAVGRGEDRIKVPYTRYIQGLRKRDKVVRICKYWTFRKMAKSTVHYDHVLVSIFKPWREKYDKNRECTNI